MMYNEELKTDFIRETTTSLKTAENCETFFNALQPFEEELGMDICCVPTEAVENIINTLVGMRSGSKICRVAILKNYKTWCVSKQISGASLEMPDLNNIGMDKIRNMMVSNPLHLQTSLDGVFDPEADRTMDNVYRGYFWLAYSGIPEEKVLDISVFDIDFVNMSIRHMEYEAPIYRQAIPTFQNLVKLTSFVYKHPLYENDIIRDRVSGTALLRGIKSDADFNTLHSTISRKISAKSGDNHKIIRLSYSRVYLSGIFYRMYERELAGIPVNFMPVAAEFMKGKSYNLSSTRNTIAAKQRKVAKSYQEDYDRWKAVFL